MLGSVFSLSLCKNVYNKSNTGVIITKYYTSIYLSGYSSETGNCSGYSYFRSFFLIAFLQEAFVRSIIINPLNPELNPICYLLALLGAHHFLHVSRIRVKLLTFRLLMSYIYIYIYIWSTHS